MPIVVARGEPAVIAGWLLGVTAAAVLGVLVWGADAPDAVVGSVVCVPWIIGPAALAALLTARAWAAAEAWLFLAAEVAAVASTVGVWAGLALAPDGQNGLGLLVLPAVQFGALLAYAWGVTVIAPVLRRRRPAAEAGVP